MHQEVDIELADLENIEYARLSQELHADPNSTPSNAGQLTTNDEYLSRSRQAELLVSQSVHYRDPTSRFCRDIDASEPQELLVPSHVELHAPDHSTTYLLSNYPSEATTRRIEQKIESFGISPSQPSHTLNNQPQFLSGEVVPHTGKGKGRIPNVEQEPDIQVSGHPYNMLQDGKLPSTRFTSHYFGRDAQFERQLYYRKKYHRQQSKARYICTAVRRDKCRVHGRLLQQRSAQQQQQQQPGNLDFDVGDVVTIGFANNMFELDVSAGPCGTVYDLSGLAEEGREAAEKKRERNWSTTDLFDVLMLLFICAMGIAAVVGVAVKAT
jgi:hypothetical protein